MFDHERIGPLDALGLAVAGTVLSLLAGPVGFVVAVGVVLARFVVPPVFVVAAALVLVATLVDGWPRPEYLVGLQVGLGVVLAGPLLRRPRPGRHLAVLGLAIGTTTVAVWTLDGALDDVLSQGVVLVVAVGLLAYGLHRYEVSRLPPDGGRGE